MALVKYGGGVSSMSGKLGGTVASRNRAGAYFRNWAFPTNTPTPSQTAQRVLFAAQSAGWSALTSSARKDWENWASGLSMLNRQGDTYTPTGRQMYMSLNTTLAGIGQATLGSPPVGAMPPTINPHASLGIVASGGTISTIQLNNADTGGLNLIQIFGAPEQTTGKNNLTTLYRYIDAYDEGASIDFKTQYITVFPNVCTVGGKWKVKARMVDPTTGLASPFLIVAGTAI